MATGKSSAAVAVRDNDEPVLRIAAGSGVAEGTSASFTVSASPVPAASLDVTVSVAQSGDVAASGATGARTVTVPTGGSVTFEVATVDDGTEEPDGSVTATVDAGTGYTAAAAPDNAATVAVSDNDAPTSGPTLSIADAAFKENRGTGYFKVTLSEKVDWPVHVYYATRDSTPVSAVAGEDYLAWKQSWRLRARFRPGQTETQIHVVLYNDSHDEDAETFEMVLFETGRERPGGGVGVDCGRGGGGDHHQLRPDAGGVAQPVRSHDGGAGARRHRRAHRGAAQRRNGGDACGPVA